MINLVPFELQSIKEGATGRQSPGDTRLQDPSTSFFDTLQSVRFRDENAVDDTRNNEFEPNTTEHNRHTQNKPADDEKTSYQAAESNQNNNTKRTNETDPNQKNDSVKDIVHNSTAERKPSPVDDSNITDKDPINYENIDINVLLQQIRTDIEKMKNSPDMDTLKQSLKNLEKLLSSLPDTLKEVKDLKTQLRSLLESLNSSGMKADKSLFSELSAKLADDVEKLIRSIENPAKKAHAANRKLFEPMDNTDTKKLLSELADTIKKISHEAASKQQTPAKASTGIVDPKVSADMAKTNIAGTPTVTPHSDAPGSNTEQNQQNSSFNFNNSNHRLFGQASLSNTPSHASAKGVFDQQLQQIMQQAKMTVLNNQNGSISMKMHPDSLGNLNVNLGLEHGVLNGRFLVENTEARQMLMDHLAHLKQSLQEQGISVGEFQVNVRNGGHQKQDTEEETQVIPGIPGHLAAEDYDTGAYHHVHEGSLDLII